MCEHKTIVFHKCVECNVRMVVMEQDKHPNGTIPNLTKYKISPEVRNKAMYIYNKHMQVDHKKGTKRKELEFFLIYCAHKELGSLVEPRVIAKMVGISTKSIGKAHATFSVSTTGYKPPIVIGNAPGLIPEFCAIIGSIESNVIKTIRDMSIEIITYYPELNEHSPQKLGAAFIQAYFDLNNYRLDRQRLCDLVNVTEGTLGSIVKIVRNLIEKDRRFVSKNKLSLSKENEPCTA